MIPPIQIESGKPNGFSIALSSEETVLRVLPHPVQRPLLADHPRTVPDTSIDNKGANRSR